MTQPSEGMPAYGFGPGQLCSPSALCIHHGVLYVADPSNSYYLQDPTGAWDGLRYFGGLVSRYSRHYSRVMLIGSSMGASAALQHARLARDDGGAVASPVALQRVCCGCVASWLPGHVATRWPRVAARPRVGEYLRTFLDQPPPPPPVGRLARRG